MPVNARPLSDTPPLTVSTVCGPLLLMWGDRQREEERRRPGGSRGRKTKEGGDESRGEETRGEENKGEKRREKDRK